MIELVLNKKEDKEILSDCVVYLLQHCKTFENSDTESIFCLDVAKKALWLYNLCPKAFGRNKKERRDWLDSLTERIARYESDDKFHTKNLQL